MNDNESYTQPPQDDNIQNLSFSADGQNFNEVQGDHNNIVLLDRPISRQELGPENNIESQQNTHSIPRLANTHSLDRLAPRPISRQLQIDQDQPPALPQRDQLHTLQYQSTTIQQNAPIRENNRVEEISKFMKWISSTSSVTKKTNLMN